MIQTDLEEHLRAQEHELATAQQRGDVAAVEALLADDFREIGSRGRLYMKPEVLEVMQQVEILGYSLQDFKFLPLGPGCVIVIYMPESTALFRERNQRAALTAVPRGCNKGTGGACCSTKLLR